VVEAPIDSRGERIKKVRRRGNKMATITCLFYEGGGAAKNIQAACKGGSHGSTERARSGKKTIAKTPLLLRKKYELEKGPYERRQMGVYDAFE